MEIIRVQMSLYLESSIDHFSYDIQFGLQFNFGHQFEASSYCGFKLDERLNEKKQKMKLQNRVTKTDRIVRNSVATCEE